MFCDDSCRAWMHRQILADPGRALAAGLTAMPEDELLAMFKQIAQGMTQ